MEHCQIITTWSKYTESSSFIPERSNGSVKILLILELRILYALNSNPKNIIIYSLTPFRLR